MSLSLSTSLSASSKPPSRPTCAPPFSQDPFPCLPQSRLSNTLAHCPVFNQFPKPSRFTVNCSTCYSSLISSRSCQALHSHQVSPLVCQHDLWVFKHSPSGLLARPHQLGVSRVQTSTPREGLPRPCQGRATCSTPPRHPCLPLGGARPIHAPLCTCSSSKVRVDMQEQTPGPGLAQ